MGTSTRDLSLFTMGRVRTKTVKKAARVIIEKYYTKLTLDFDTNKRIIEEVAVIPSKPLRNKIAGFITHLMKRLQRSTVRDISVPDVSELEKDVIEVDAETKEMLKMMDFQSIPGLQMTTSNRPGFSNRS